MEQYQIMKKDKKLKFMNERLILSPERDHLLK